MCWYALINSISIHIFQQDQNMVKNNRSSTTTKNEFISWQKELVRVDLVASRLYESQSSDKQTLRESI